LKVKEEKEEEEVQVGKFPLGTEVQLQNKTSQRQTLDTPEPNPQTLDTPEVNSQTLDTPEPNVQTLDTLESISHTLDTPISERTAPNYEPPETPKSRNLGANYNPLEQNPHSHSLELESYHKNL
jgi:hypothetical protein